MAAYANPGTPVTTYSSTPGTEHLIDLPPGKPGDLGVIAVIYWNANIGTPDPPGEPGYFKWAHQGVNLGTSDFNMGVLTHYYDGKEGDGTGGTHQMLLRTSNTCKALAMAMKIEDFHKAFDDSSVISISTILTNAGSTSTPDHPSRTHAAGAGNHLVIAGGFAYDDAESVSSFDWDMDASYQVSAGTTNDGACIWMGVDQITGTDTKDPGTITLTDTELCRTWTMIIGEFTAHPAVQSAHYLVKNMNDGTEYYASNEGTETGVASLTKLMNIATLAQEIDTTVQSNLDATYTIVTGGLSNGDFIGDLVGGTGNNLSAGDVIDVEDLVYNMMLESSNLSAVALAAHLGEISLGGTPTHAQSVAEYLSLMDANTSAWSHTSPAAGYASPDGFSIVNNLTADDIYDLLKRVSTDAFSVNVMKQAERTISYNDGAPQTLDIFHIWQGTGWLNAAGDGAFYGKGGTGGGFHAAMIMETLSGDDIAIICLETDVDGEQHDDIRYFIKQLRDNFPALFSVPSGLVKVVDETEQLSEAKNRVIALNRLIAETQQLIPGNLRSMALARSIAETLSNAEAIVDILGESIVEVVNETIQLTEARDTALGLVRDTTETVQPGEAQVPSLVLVRLLSETIQLTEALDNVLGLVRENADSIQLTEALDNVLGIVRSTGDSLSLTELQDTALGLVREIAETIQLAETLEAVLGIVRSSSETVSLNEASDTAKGIVRDVADSLSLSEALDSAIGIVRDASDSLSITDAVTRTSALNRLTAETANLAEVNQTASSLIRLLNEVEALQEDPIGSVALLRVLAETLELAESIERTLGAVKQIDETVQLPNEVIDLALGIVRTFAESISLSEGAVSFVTLIRQIDETLQQAEQILATRAFNKIIDESESLSEQLLPVRALIRLFDENVSNVESTIGSRVIARSVVESVQITEAVLSSIVAVTDAVLTATSVSIVAAVTASIEIEG